jgi:glutathione synthase/RimK-type ligase-like ATP-grasp enzyme
MSRSKVVFANSPRGRAFWGKNEGPVTENHPLVDGLVERGFDAIAHPWYEPVDWFQFDHIIVNSPSDLYFHIDDFTKWINGLETHSSVMNEPGLLAWNMDKHYLKEIESRGVDIAPTIFVELGDEPEFPDREYVVKPVTSGGALNTGRFLPYQEQEARELVKRIHNEKLAVIVQPYLESVDRIGEKALVFYNEQFDHAIKKDAVLAPGSKPGKQDVSHPNPTPYQPTNEELELARKAIAVSPRRTPLLYSRVDLAEDNGTPIVMELEYLDPVLFFEYSEGSLNRYIDAIIERIS